MLVVFTADWCGNCQGLLEELESLEQTILPGNNKDYGYYVNITEHVSDARNEFNLRSVPAIVEIHPEGMIRNFGRQNVVTVFKEDLQAAARWYDENYEKGN